MENAAWLKSGICDLEKDTKQQVIKPAKRIVVVSTMKVGAVLFLNRKNNRQPKKTVVNSCLASRKGSDIVLKKTKGSKAKKSNRVKSKPLFLVIEFIKEVQVLVSILTIRMI